MQFSIYINQLRALEWGLNLQQTVLFGFLYDAQSWADERIIDGKAYYWISKEKVCQELPILSDKPDTIKKHMQFLESAGLILRKAISNRVYVCLTDVGKLWNKTDGFAKGGEKSHQRKEKPANKRGDKNPTIGGKNLPPKGGKISHPRGEKSPPYQITNNQITNDQPAAACHPDTPPVLVEQNAAVEKDFFDCALRDGDQLSQSRRFAMFADWQPSGTFAELLRLNRVDVSALDLETQDDILAEFVSYRMSARPEDLKSQGEWEHKLIQKLKRYMASPSKSNQRAMVSAAVMDVGDLKW